MCAVDLSSISIVLVFMMSLSKSMGGGGGRGGTFSIASRTRGLLINCCLNKLSTNSLFVEPEQRQAMLLRFLLPRKMVRRRFSLAVAYREAASFNWESKLKWRLRIRIWKRVVVYGNV